MQNQKIQLSFLFLLVSLIFLSCGESKAQTEVESNNKISMKVSEKKEKVLRHVVLFKFKDDADQAAVSKINEAFNALPAAIPEIKDFEWGINDSPEDFHQDFTHCIRRRSRFGLHPTSEASRICSELKTTFRKSIRCGLLD
jgi:hypothetical protein